jgi:hypothetical protein
MRYSVRVTDGHCYRDLEIETDKGVEEACSLAMERATETQQWEIVETFECSRCDGETRIEERSLEDPA